jgi:hypothetical protein
VFSSISSSLIVAGEPVKQELWTKTKDNFDDHESRISSLETTSLVFKPIDFYISGHYYIYGTQSGVLFEKLTYDIEIQSTNLILLTTGSAGNLEVDLLFKRGANPFVSVYATKPILNNTASQFDINTGVLSTTTLLAGDVLRLDITQAMTNNTGFMLQLEYGV